MRSLNMNDEQLKILNKDVSDCIGCGRLEEGQCKSIRESLIKEDVKFDCYIPDEIEVVNE